MSISYWYLVGFCAIACYAALSPIAKILRLDIPPFAMIAVSTGMLSVMALIISLNFEKEFSFAKIASKTWVGIIVFSLINLVGFALYLLTIARIPVAQYQLIGLMAPVLGGFLSYWLLGENLKIQYLYGLVFMCAGLFIALYDGAK